MRRIDVAAKLSSISGSECDAVDFSKWPKGPGRALRSRRPYGLSPNVCWSKLQSMDKKYQERRVDIEAMFEPSHCHPNERRVIVSPSGNFRLTVDTYSRGPGTWSYSRGRVQRIRDGKEIADIKRNIGHFFHLWVEHSNGIEYLICGEDYQGQTIVNLTSGKENIYFSEAGYEGIAFCWADA